MQVIKVILVVLMLMTLSCKQKARDSELLLKYPKTDDISKNLKYIFTNGFNFSDNIKVNEIAVKRNSKNRYQIIYFLDKKNDFKTIEKLNIGFRVYPESPELFLNDTYKKDGARTIATKAEIKRMGSSLVVISKNFLIAPKKFKETKVYFYSPKGGVLGRKMTILDLSFDF